MSSRRKSRPVRRLDTICSKLQGSGGITMLPPTWTSRDGSLEDGTLSPELADEGTHASGSPISEAEVGSNPDAGTAEAENEGFQKETANKVAFTARPPEGVYVLQPESVSDDEEMDGLKPRDQSNTSETDGRKRSCGEAESATAIDSYMKSENESYSGLDLSVKRPRIDSTLSECADFEKTNNHTPIMHYSSLTNLFLENSDAAQNPMDKYHRLMGLVAQQKPLVQAIEEVGLSMHEFFALHRFNGQLASSEAEKQLKQLTRELKFASAPPTVKSIFNKFPPKGHQVSVNFSIDDDWAMGKAKRDAKIQDLLKVAKEDVIQQQNQSSEAQQLNNSRLQQHPTTLNPTMAAAVMASLSSNPDQSTEERQEVLRKIFFKTQGMFTQNETPTKSMESFNSSMTSPSLLDRTNASKNDSITAGTVSSGVGSIKRGTLDPSNFDEDVFDKYIAKFTNINRCGLLTCQYYTRDHYHCVVDDCNYQRFTNKADVIRHYNMHKKRDNSLAHGFLRFSPTEDCSLKYPNCHLNGKSTHYHCMQTDCNKVYTSTSDVMTHENFHKKYMQFVCSGFKRFRATEECDLEACTLRNQKTTHFHCTRADCHFTFKNKCDIEKHKTYHLRDDQYISKGFKKFYKNETCGDNDCVWNYTANHFHCLRLGCNFSFTSTSQMESHKRKHDRNEYLCTNEGKDGKSASSSGFPPSTSRRKPDPPLMSHYKLTPKNFKFTPFIPSTSRHKDLPKPVQVANSYPYPFPGPAILLSPSYPANLPTVNSGPVVVPASSGLPTRSHRQYLSHSVLSPFSPYMTSLASRYVANNGINGDIHNSLKIPIPNRAIFQEAAKRILSLMPAASIPRIIGASTLSQQIVVKSEPTYYANVNSSQSELVLPITPLTARSYTNHVSKIGTDKYKEEQNWNITGLGDDAVMHTASSISYTIPRDVSPVTSEIKTSSTTDWPRNRGVISPSMAINAAAALKPSSKITENSESSSLTAGKKEPDRLAGNEERVYERVPRDSNKDFMFKYFASAEPYKCWINDCDFFTKHHYHCVVENCEAMFTTEDNVMKHTKFHEKLEIMGVALPMRSLSVSSKWSVSSQVSNESYPPPGYITLQSGMPKPSLFEYNPQEGCDTHHVADKQEKENGDEPTPAEKQMTGFVPNGMAYSHEPLSTLAAQMYANDLLKGGVSESISTPLSSTPVYGYRLMQNPTSLTALIARMTKSTPGQGLDDRNAVMPTEVEPIYAQKKTDNGYILIKTGMPCLRQDCKYAHQNHWHCTINRCRYVCKSLGKAQTHRQAHDSLDAYARSAKECFRSYSVKKQCPNPNCEFRLRGHYHCLKPGCTFATIGTSKLPWHMKKHEKIARREASGFKYYTKKERCSYQDCKYNGLFSHYHCVRKGCTFAFQYKHQMSTHVRKHLRRMLGRTYTPGPGDDMQDIDHTNVDSGDDSLPLIIDEMEEAEQRPGLSTLDDPKNTEQLSQQQMKVLDQITKHTASSYVPTHPIQGAENEDGSVCVDHGESNSDDYSIGPYEALDLGSLAAGSSKSNESGCQQQFLDVELVNEDSLSNGMGNSNDEAYVNMAVENEEIPHADLSLTQKGRDPGPGQFNRFKLGEGVLDGFRRYETNEKCGNEECTYMHKMSHYHCIRDKCDYHFTGRSHMFKHQQHHDRVAGLVRDDFKRFKATHQCEDEKCEYRGKNTHFHCLRCSFKCTDSAKVGTHRRQHMKSDALEQSGFQRVRGKEDCGREDCKYRFKNMSHFHCLQSCCNYTIVGLTGIELHAEKHKRGFLQPAAAAERSGLMQSLAVFRNMQQHMLNVSLVQSDPEDGGMAHNLSLQTLAAFRDMQNQTAMPGASRTPTPTEPSDNGHSNQSSPFLMAAQGEPGHLLSKFAFLSTASQGTITAAPSPATSTSISIVSEGVGS